MLKRTITKIFLTAAFISILTSGGYPVPFAGPANLQAAPLPENGVVVYQFHRRFRCDACHKLEEAINEALKVHFEKELSSGRLIYKVIDLDAEGSDYYSKAYDFFCNTVIMVDMENGKEIRFKNLEDVWELVDQKDATMEFIRSHIAEYL